MNHAALLPLCFVATVSAQTAAPPVALYRLDPQHTFVHFEVKHFDTSTLRGRVGPVRGRRHAGSAPPAGAGWG